MIKYVIDDRLIRATVLPSIYSRLRLNNTAMQVDGVELRSRDQALQMFASRRLDITLSVVRRRHRSCCLATSVAQSASMHGQSQVRQVIMIQSATVITATVAVASLPLPFTPVQSWWRAAACRQGARPAGTEKSGWWAIAVLTKCPMTLVTRADARVTTTSSHHQIEC